MLGRLATLLALAGCQEVFGLTEPTVRPIDASADVPADASIDAAPLGPCGADAGVLPATVFQSKDNGKTKLTVSMIQVGGSQQPTVRPEAMVPFSFQYLLTSTACATNCVLQIEIGFVPGDRIACVFDAVVDKLTGAQGDISSYFAAPSVPGRYELRVNIGANFGCTYQGANTWWGGQPPASATIAHLCVAANP